MGALPGPELPWPRLPFLLPFPRAQHKAGTQRGNFPPSVPHFPSLSLFCFLGALTHHTHAHGQKFGRRVPPPRTNPHPLILSLGIMSPINSLPCLSSSMSVLQHCVFLVRLFLDRLPFPLLLLLPRGRVRRPLLPNHSVCLPFSPSPVLVHSVYSSLVPRVLQFRLFFDFWLPMGKAYHIHMVKILRVNHVPQQTKS